MTPSRICWAGIRGIPFLRKKIAMPMPDRIPSLGCLALYTNPQEAFQANLLVHEARIQGHAVCLYEIYDDRQHFESATVLHYKTCTLCLKGVPHT